MAKRKIWWQSSTKEGGFPPYKASIEAHAKKFLGPDYEVVMHGVPVFCGNIGYMGFFTMNAAQVLNRMLDAPGEGFDAVAIGCFEDPSLSEARELLDIPVFGMGQTALVWAQLYGKKPGIINYERLGTNKSLKRIEEAYNLGGIIAPTTTFDISLDDLAAGFTNPDKVLELATAAAKKAVENGADIVVPGCGLLNLILADNGVNKVPGTGAPIMDVTAILMETVAAAIEMHEKAGFITSRQGFYERPSEEGIAHARETYFGKQA